MDLRYIPVGRSSTSEEIREKSRKLTHRRRFGRIFDARCYSPPLGWRQNPGEFAETKPRMGILRIWPSRDYNPHIRQSVEFRLDLPKTHIDPSRAEDRAGYAIFPHYVKARNSTKVKQNSRKLTNRRRSGRIFSSRRYNTS